MPTVISVKFKYAARDLWFEPAGTGAQEGDHVICDTERGQEIGLATSDAVDMSREELGHIIGDVNRLKQVVRVATDKDLERAEMLARRADDAFPTFRDLVHASGLDMKPVGVEYLFGGGKVVCYFSAEERVDFRQLVRDLSRELHERIDMRQIGVREEAAIVGGFAHCGQELCCARFGHQFEPVSIRMAKEQDLPLNSTKISGACGRLMCCLRYEFEAYRDFKQRAPKRNAVIETPLGKAKIVEYDTPKEQICLRLENGKQVRVPLSGMEASEAAHKKSEELGCACRPDTVTREALEKLSSPDVQMALAELDRKNGVVESGDGFDSPDIFVEAKPRRRSRAAKAEQPEVEKEEPKVEVPAEPKPRRRRKKAVEPEKPAEAAAATPKHAASKKVEADVADAAPSRRRRRHKSAEGAPEAAPAAPAEKPKPAAKAAPAEKQALAPRHARKPGDKGGAARRAAAAAAPAANAAAEAEASADAAKKKRRRRGSRGRGKGGQAGGEQAGE